MANLEAVLLEDLGDEADRLVGHVGTCYALRLAMLQFFFHLVSRAKLQWPVAESDALRRFRAEVVRPVRDAMIAQSRACYLGETGATESFSPVPSMLADIWRPFGGQVSIASGNDRTWMAFVLNYLWRVCCNDLQIAEGANAAITHAVGNGVCTPNVVGKRLTVRCQGSLVTWLRPSSAAQRATRRHRVVLLAAAEDFP